MLLEPKSGNFYPLFYLVVVTNMVVLIFLRSIDHVGCYNFGWYL
jgi:hypothetical protein